MGSIAVFSSKNYDPSANDGWEVLKKYIQQAEYTNGISLALGNTRPGNQDYMMNYKSYRKYDSSNKSNYLDVEIFSQYIRPKYSRRKKG